MHPAAHKQSRKLRWSSELGFATIKLTIERGAKMIMLFSAKDG
jgi:hypothetical protein